ncbi:MAG: hypothetical protein ACRED5_12765 [Propylenella sp.]
MISEEASSAMLLLTAPVFDRGFDAGAPMPDAHSQVTTLDPGMLDTLIKAMEIRAADACARAIRQRVLMSVGFPGVASVLEAGCGSGAVCRDLASWPNVGEVIRT